MGNVREGRYTPFFMRDLPTNYLDLSAVGFSTLHQTQIGRESKFSPISARCLLLGTLVRLQWRIGYCSCLFGDIAVG